jgi:flagellar motor switch protein FliN/FliY
MAETDKSNIPLPDLDASAGAVRQEEVPVAPDQATVRSASDLEAVFDVPVQVSAVLGRTRMDVGDPPVLGLCLLLSDICHLSSVI